MLLDLNFVVAIYMNYLKNNDVNINSGAKRPKGEKGSVQGVNSNFQVVQITMK